MQCWLDGKYYFVNDPIFTLDDWRNAFQVGFTFSVRAYGCSVPYFGLYYEHLLQSLELAKFPDFAFLSEELLRKTMTDLLQKNRYHRNAFVRFSIFIRYYDDVFGESRPTTSLLIEALPLEGQFFDPQIAPAKLISYRRDLRVPRENTALRWLADPLIWGSESMSKRFACTDCVLYNTSERIVQTAQRDLYCINNNTITTPPLTEGGALDPFREILQILARQVGYGFEMKPLGVDYVMHSQELFLGSSRYGIEPVISFDGTYYSVNRTRELIPHLNRILFPEYCA